MTQTIPDNDPINQACLWVARLGADDASQADHIECKKWRESSPQHEKAWQQVMILQQQFTNIPDRHLGSKILRSSRGNGRRQILTLAGLVLGVSALGLDPFSTFMDSGLRYATAKGEIRHLQLADGTRLVMNTDSKINVQFDEHSRRILLHKGEVFIETHSDARQFSVVSRDGILQPLGTQFSIQQLDRHSRLNVFEGKVRITPTQVPTQQKVISAGYGNDFTALNTHDDFNVGLVDNAWIKSKLAVANMPITEFADQLSRYRLGILRVSPELSSLTITGTFSLEDTDRILEQLTEILPIKVRYLSPYIVTIHPS